VKHGHYLALNRHAVGQLALLLAGQQVLVVEPLAQGLGTDGQALSLLAGQFLRGGVSGVGLEGEVRAADPAHLPPQLVVPDDGTNLCPARSGA
jgi:hypothetical protein